jgi:hypothetical protein
VEATLLVFRDGLASLYGCFTPGEGDSGRVVIVSSPSGRVDGNSAYYYYCYYYYYYY